MNILDYYFFKFNQLILFNRIDDDTVINTFIGIAFIFSCNILSIVYIMDISISISGGLIIFFSLVLLLYFQFIYNFRYINIKNKYEKSDPYPILGKVIVIAYSVLSVFIVVLLAYMIRTKGEISV